jgi:hypothetical protein
VSARTLCAKAQDCDGPTPVILRSLGARRPVTTCADLTRTTRTSDIGDIPRPNATAAARDQMNLASA